MARIKTTPRWRDSGRADPIRFAKNHYAGWIPRDLKHHDWPLWKDLKDLGELELALLAPGEPIRWKHVRHKEGADPLAFANEHYNGLTPTDIKNADWPLWKLLSDLGILSELKETSRDPLDVYVDKYLGLTRSELIQADRSLYDKIRKAGLLPVIPPSYDLRDIDPLRAYTEFYDGLSRGELAKKDKKLYNRMYRRELLEHVPLQRKQYDDPALIYNRDFSGVTRTELSRLCSGLYRRLLHDDLIYLVPTVADIGRDPLQIYLKFYSGFSKKQLEKANRLLYDHLRRDGFLERLPSTRYFGGNLVKYYETFHTAQFIEEIDDSAPDFGKEIRLRGLSHHFPSVEPRRMADGLKRLDPRAFDYLKERINRARDFKRRNPAERIPENF